MRIKKRKKIFVLDTNVILHDSSCLYSFQENDIVIPIKVLEELDKFKKGNETINLHARRFLRKLDKLSDGDIFKAGVKIKKNLGHITILLEQKFHKDIAFSFSIDYADHHILNVAYTLSKKIRGREVVLVTKDVNLRLKAKAVGLTSEDYRADQVERISELYKGYLFHEDISESLIDKIKKAPHQLEVKELGAKEKIMPNEYIVLRNKSQSVLGYLDPEDNKVKRIESTSAYGIRPRNVEQVFAIHALLNPQIKLVTITGKAGTGKTLLALAAAMESRAIYREILLSRPVISLSDKDLGYLPGGIQDKLNPYMQPIYDNLGVLKQTAIDSNIKAKKLSKMLEDENLVISPLAYIRGRSLVDVYFIIDESQNLTPHEIKTVITRAGANTKLVFTGDIFQIDHPYLDLYSNGLSYLIDKMQGQKLYTHINLEKGERSELAEIASNLL